MFKIKVITALTILHLSILFCNGQTAKDSFYNKKITEPGVRFIPVYNSKYKVFTQKLGQGKIKLLLLHGGPANTHEYFENFPGHLMGNDIEIYYYDQLGSYYSDQPNDTSIWNVTRFVDEVEEVRKGLGLADFYILGHSWGAMLAQLYAAKYPENLKGIILSNVPADITDTARRNVYINEWRNEVHKTIIELPAFGKSSSLSLDSIRNGMTLSVSPQNSDLKKLYDKKRDSVVSRNYSYRLSDKMPEPLARNILHINRKHRDENRFAIKILEPDYPAADQQIKCPVLILGGAHDRWFPKVYPEMKKQFLKTKVRVYLCPNGSHFSMWDDTENYFRELIRFLKEVE